MPESLYDPIRESPCHLEIGGLVLALAWTDPSRPAFLARSARPFRVPVRPADVAFVHHFDAEPPDLSGRVVFAATPIWRFRVGQDGTRRYELTVPGDAPSPRALDIAPGLSRADLYSAPSWRERAARNPDPLAVARSLFEDPFDQIFFIDRLWQERSGLIFHGASVVAGGEAFLFAAASGGGKTTLSRAIRTGRVLTDDRTIVRATPGGLVAHGSPWYGDPSLKSAGQAPLSAVYLLDRSLEPGVHPIGRLEAYRELVRVSFPAVWDRGGVEFALEVVERMIEEIPVARLSFVRGEDVLERIRLGRSRSGSPPSSLRPPRSPS